MTNPLKNTTLTKAHQDLQAKMGPFAGFNMPIQYKSIKQEVMAVRNSAGVFDVSHMGEFFVTGPQAVDFVDYIITNDFKNTPISKAVYSPLCNEEGFILDDLIAYKLSAKKVLICVNAANIVKDWQWINQFAPQFQCQLTNVSDEYSLLALQGPKTIQALQALGLLPKTDFSYYSALEHPYKNEKIILARTGYTGEDGVEIFCSHGHALALWRDLRPLGITPCGLAARDVLRLEVCYPLYGHELTEQTTPYDGGIGWTVKLAKEDFVGKKALALKPSHHKLVKLSLSKGIPRAGHLVLNKQREKIGVVTSGTMSVTNGNGIALALVEKEKMPPDLAFFIEIRNKATPAEHHQSPFITGGHK